MLFSSSLAGAKVELQSMWGSLHCATCFSELGLLVGFINVGQGRDLAVQNSEHARLKSQSVRGQVLSPHKTSTVIHCSGSRHLQRVCLPELRSKRWSQYTFNRDQVCSHCKEMGSSGEGGIRWSCISSNFKGRRKRVEIHVSIQAPFAH
jgi:hypothetical protein